MAKPDWITLGNSSGTGGASVQVTAGANASTSQRSGILTIKTASGLTKTVSVEQAGLVLNLVVGGSSGYIEKITVP